MTSGRGPEGPQRGSVEDSASGVRDDVLTVPNVLSALRLVGVPVFLWAILTERDALAIVLLVASGITDYLDGKIARHYGLVSRVGQLLDEAGRPTFVVRGTVAAQVDAAGISSIHVSLSHDAGIASAVVVLET